jgi:transposase-like protein
MTKKTKAAYVQIFKLLADRFGIDIKSAMTDYEIGLRNAISTVYPNAILQGCWFHYTQVNF